MPAGTALAGYHRHLTAGTAQAFGTGTGLASKGQLGLVEPLLLHLVVLVLSGLAGRTDLNEAGREGQYVVQTHGHRVSR
jgi:hypothetical protein